MFRHLYLDIYPPSLQHADIDQIGEVSPHRQPSTRAPVSPCRPGSTICRPDPPSTSPSVRSTTTLPASSSGGLHAQDQSGPSRPTCESSDFLPRCCIVSGPRPAPDARAPHRNERCVARTMPDVREDVAAMSRCPLMPGRQDPPPWRWWRTGSRSPATPAGRLRQHRRREPAGLRLPVPDGGRPSSPISSCAGTGVVRPNPTTWVTGRMRASDCGRSVVDPRRHAQPTPCIVSYTPWVTSRRRSEADCGAPWPWDSAATPRLDTLECGHRHRPIEAWLRSASRWPRLTAFTTRQLVESAELGTTSRWPAGS